VQALKEDTKPNWGTMSATAMLDHLRIALELSISNVPVNIVTPQEKLAVYKAFLMSEKPFQKGSPVPKEFYTIPVFKGDFEATKSKFLEAVIKMLDFFDKNPEHTLAHAYFGLLNVTEWKHLHRKHFLHHFTQFDIIAPQ